MQGEWVQPVPALARELGQPYATGFQSEALTKIPAEAGGHTAHDALDAQMAIGRLIVSQLPGGVVRAVQPSILNFSKTDISITYRYSSASGDDPATSRYERWDLLYSGGDIDSWVQGQLMKNIQYNSNVKVHRVLARATPDPRWRFTAAVSSYRADTLNNVGGVISALAGHDLGRELLLVAEHYASRQIYWRFTFASLWPGPGVSQSLPKPVEKPWLVGIAQFNINY